MRRRGFLGALLAGCALPWRSVAHEHAWEHDVMADRLVCPCGAFIDGEAIDARIVAIDQEAASLTMSGGWRSSFSEGDYLFVQADPPPLPPMRSIEAWIPADYEGRR